MPRTPKTTKRNLSNSSPSQNAKKTKVFIFSNRYAELKTDENNEPASPKIGTTEDPDSPLSNKQNIKPQMPLI